MRKYLRNLAIAITIIVVGMKIPCLDLKVDLKANTFELEHIENEIVYANGVPKTNEEIVWYYLKEKGLTPVQIAGIMGNIQQECRFNQNLIESNGEGIGLIQWSFERKRSFLLYAGEQKSNIYKQLEYLMIEMDTQWTENYKYVFYNTNSVREATEAFCWGFERPSKQYAHIDYRISSAEGFYERFK